MVQLNKFCCCCSLKCGAVFIGVVLIIFGIFEAAQSIYAFTGGNLMYDLRLNKEDAEGTPTKEETIPMAYQVVNFISNIVCILAASSLLFASFKSKASFVIPILILIPVNTTIAWIITFFSIGSMADDIKYVTIGFLVITFLFNLYFWICLFSFWKQLKEQAGEGREANEEIVEKV